MATYKVLQDIEAEDKLVGPLTLRQFIYAGVTAVCLYLCFILLTKHLYFGVPIFLLPAILTGFFAFPFGRDQPTEIWALAKIRFLLKPRRRIWDQSGTKELVSITAPKRIEVNYTNGLSQNEVKSRLQALADTIDTRGWAVKNVTGGVYASNTGGQDPDRLIDVGNIPQTTPMPDARNTADIMDEQTSPVAQNFARMMQRSDHAHREQIIQTLGQPQVTDAISPQLPRPQIPQDSPGSANDHWFMNQPQASSNPKASSILPGAAPLLSQASSNPTADEDELAEQLHKQSSSQDAAYSHLHKILPLSEQKALADQTAQAAAAAKAKQAPVTRPADPAIMALARNNDLNVATIARQAKRDNPPDEVVISLH